MDKFLTTDEVTVEFEKISVNSKQLTIPEALAAANKIPKCKIYIYLYYKLKTNNNNNNKFQHNCFQLFLWKISPRI